MEQPEEPASDQGRLLSTLQRLLEIEAIQVHSAMERASHLISEALGVDKVDTFLFDPSSQTLVAVGVSDTPMGFRQRELGLDRLPVANGGRTVESYLEGTTYVTGRADQDPVVLDGIKHGLGVRSMVVIPLLVNAERRGVLTAVSARADYFTPDDLHFLEAVASWLGILVHRAELVERIAHEAAERGRRAAAEELITVLAHDLGNYLTPIKGRLDLLRRRALRDGREQDVKHVEAADISVTRVQRLIHDLLDASRLDQGLFSLSRERLDCVALARETASLLTTAQTRVDVVGVEELPIQADPNRLRQALENLLGNAIKHSPPGVPVSIEVRRERGEGGEWAIMSVRDEGPGIAPEIVPALFDRFMVGLNSKGLGLGLYLARGIAEAHGGTLTFESVPGQGATFTLSLPASC